MSYAVTTITAGLRRVRSLPVVIIIIITILIVVLEVVLDVYSPPLSGGISTLPKAGYVPTGPGLRAAVTIAPSLRAAISICPSLRTAATRPSSLRAGFTVAPSLGTVVTIAPGLSATIVGSGYVATVTISVTVPCGRRAALALLRLGG